MQLDWHIGRTDLANLELLSLEDIDGGIDHAAVRGYRLARVRAEMRRREIAACILFDPVNIRYATGARNMQVFHARNPSRYLLLTLDGPVILYEFAGCMHLVDGLETITEVRSAITASFVAAGEDIAARERQWANEMAATLRELIGPRAVIGLERVNAGAAHALATEGFTLVDA